MALKVFIDGSADNHLDKPLAGWGAVCYEGDFVRFALNGSQTNIKSGGAEVLALYEALMALLRLSLSGEEVEVYSDSEYVVKAVNQMWIQKWKKNKWMTTGKKEVKNLNLWKNIDMLLEVFSDLSIYHIKGHAGHEGNEVAHQLANKARREALNAL